MTYRRQVVDECRLLASSQLTVFYVEIGDTWEDDYKVSAPAMSCSTV